MIQLFERSIKSFCGIQTERFTEIHRVDPGIDVQDQVHLEGLALAVQAAHYDKKRTQLMKATSITMCQP